MESIATGHQRAESVMNRTLYLKHRREKLKNQEERPAPSTSSTSNSTTGSPFEIQPSSSRSSASATSSSTIKSDEPLKTKKLVMTGVRVYINGYLSDTTDIEMKRTVTLAGGQVLSVPSQSSLCTRTNAISYPWPPTYQPDAIQRNSHPDVPRPERLEDPQTSSQELENQSPCREARMGRGQHQRRKEVARTTLHHRHKPHHGFRRQDVRRTAL